MLLADTTPALVQPDYERVRAAAAASILSAFAQRARRCPGVAAAAAGPAPPHLAHRPAPPRASPFGHPTARLPRPSPLAQALFINKILSLLWPHLSPAIHKEVMKQAKAPIEAALAKIGPVQDLRIDRLDLGER